MLQKEYIFCKWTRQMTHFSYMPKVSLYRREHAWNSRCCWTCGPRSVLMDLLSVTPCSSCLFTSLNLEARLRERDNVRPFCLHNPLEPGGHCALSRTWGQKRPTHHLPFTLRKQENRVTRERHAGPPADWPENSRVYIYVCLQIHQVIGVIARACEANALC